MQASTFSLLLAICMGKFQFYNGFVLHPMLLRSPHLLPVLCSPIINDLLDESQDTATERLSAEEEQKLAAQLQESAPSELQIRMNLLGINNVTLAGFAVAFVLFALNNILGTGWLGDYFGLNDTNHGEITSEGGSEERNNLKQAMSKDVVINYKDIQDRLNPR